MSAFLDTNETIKGDRRQLRKRRSMRVVGARIRALPRLQQKSKPPPTQH